MFNVEEFNAFIKLNYNKNIIFIYNEQIQSMINNNSVCSCENIEKIIINIMNNDFYVEIIMPNPDYALSYATFTHTFRNQSYNRFNYFFCSLTQSNNRAVVIFPLKYRDEFYKRVSKINNLKAFL